jgi:hypothetical protein
VNNALVPFCPAIPQICYQPHAVLRDTLAPTAIDLLEENQAIVITGHSKSCFELNRDVGKTSAVKNRLMPRLRRKGRKVSYTNMQKLVMKCDTYGHRFYDYRPLIGRKKKIGTADVHVFDEIQHIFPLADQDRLFRLRGKPYADVMIEFWSSVADHLERGGRAVFITLQHPLASEYRDMMIDRAMSVFFTSPIIEMQPWFKYFLKNEGDGRPSVADSSSAFPLKARDGVAQPLPES